MRKTTLGAGLVAAAASIALAPAAHATDWQKVDCFTPSPYPSSVQVCLYYASGNQAQGRFINNSPYDISNQGYFQSASSGKDDYCGLVTTKHGTTSTCTRSLTGTWHLVDTYTYSGSKYTKRTADHNYGS